MRGRVIIITGASSGLGQALAVEFARRGARLVLHARNLERLESIRLKCVSLGSTVFTIIGDLRDRDVCQQLIEFSLSKFSRIDYLVLNAGVGQWADLSNIESLDVIKELIETNYLGAAYCTFHALPHVISSRGMFVVISSIQGRIGVHRHTGYSASKHALQGFFDSLRVELYGTGVDVLMVYPGWIAGTRLRERALGSNRGLGSSPQRVDGVVEAAQCAFHIANGINERKREMFLPRYYALLPFLRLIFPKFVEWIVRVR